MAVKYNKLWELPIDKEVVKTQLRLATDMSITLTKLEKAILK